MSLKKECDDCELHLRGMKIGKELKKRIKTGNVGEDRIKEFEKKEMRKVECVDEVHTKLYNLTTKEANRYISKFTEYLKNAPSPACLDLKQRVFSCLEENRNDTFKCSDDVEAFAGCVDDMMLEAVRHDSVCTKPSSEKKLTYTEKFEKICLCN